MTRLAAWLACDDLWEDGRTSAARIFACLADRRVAFMWFATDTNTIFDPARALREPDGDDGGTP